MKKSFILLLLICTNYVFAQPFQVESPKQPFYRIIEWKGRGSILLSRDPSFTQKQVDMQLIGPDGKTTWQQVLNPMVEEPYFISEDGGKYAYFLESLEPKNGHLFIHQLSAAGNIKTSNLNFLAAVKRLGDFPVNDLEAVDIVTTEKALVWLFRYTDKSKDKIFTIAVSMTHHNFTLFAYVVSENATAKSKVENQIAWYIAGEKGENIIFAARVHAGKESGWRIQEFSPKGVLINQEVLDQNGTDFIAHDRVGFGRRGSALLKRVEPSEKGTLLYAEGHFYVGGIVNAEDKYYLQTYIWEDKKWKLLNKNSIEVYNPKKGLEVGYFRMSEGMGWFVRNTKGFGYLHPYASGDVVACGPIEQDTYNPSRLLTAEFPTKFVELLETKWLVFDLGQLPAKGTVTFEFIQK